MAVVSYILYDQHFPLIDNSQVISRKKIKSNMCYEVSLALKTKGVNKFEEKNQVVFFFFFCGQNTVLHWTKVFKMAFCIRVPSGQPGQG